MMGIVLFILNMLSNHCYPAEFKTRTPIPGVRFTDLIIKKTPKHLCSAIFHGTNLRWQFLQQNIFFFYFTCILCFMVIAVDIISHRVVLISHWDLWWTEEKCVYNTSQEPKRTPPRCSEKFLEPNQSSEND